MPVSRKGRAQLDKAIDSLKKQDRFVRANDFRRMLPDIHPRTGKMSWPHRCEAIREFPYANDAFEGAKSLEWFRCHMPAKYKFGERRLCGRHAGVIALEKMVECPHSMIFWPDISTIEELRERLKRR